MAVEIASNASNSLILRRIYFLLRRYWIVFVLVSGGVFALSAYNTFQTQPIFEASGELILDKTNSTSALTGVAQGVGQLESISDPLNTQSQVIRSSAVVNRAIKALALKDKNGVSLKKEAVGISLTVIPVKGTDLIRISYRSPNPKEASALVNEIMRSYISSDIDANRSTTRSARNFINQQLPKVLQALTLAESELQAFREKNGIVNLAKETESSVESAAKLDTEITEINAQLSSAESEYNDLSSQVGVKSSQAVALSKISQSPSIQQVLQELQKVDEQLASQKTLYTPTHPLVQQQELRFEALKSLLNERIKSTLGKKLPDEIAVQLQNSLPISDGRLQLGQLEQSLLSKLIEVEIKRNSLNQRKKEFTASMLRYSQRAKEFSQLERLQRQLERKVEVSRVTYVGLLTKLQEVQLAENQKVGNARILNQAEPPTVPISPIIPRNLALGGITGILLASGLIWFIQSLDNTLRSSEEISENYRYPILGVLPHLDQNGKNGKGKKFRTKEIQPEQIKVFVRDQPRSPTSEAFRILQTNLRFLRSDTPIKSMVITSALPAEGKSTLSANLAAVMAQSGRRVLLVDADLRRSEQFRIWNIPRYPGLSEVMIGEKAWEDSLELVMPNLWVLPSGTNPPNPVALFDSKRMAQLLEEWKSKYDYVLIDSPPILAVADALLLGKDADGMLIVSRAGLLRSVAAQRVRTILEQSGINVMGLAINDIKAQGSDYSYYVYHHYYTTNVDRNDKTETRV
jgi:polysaccharide biosynthesis transport protein